MYYYIFYDLLALPCRAGIFYKTNITVINQARASMQAGKKKGNVRERSMLGKANRDGQENSRTEQSTVSTDPSRYAM